MDIVESNLSFGKSKDSVLEDKRDTYTVKSVDILYSISKKFNITVDELKKLNNLESNVIFPRQILRIL
ncbi:MAG: LysM peptidoglycan-binding domain-containing protein [Tepidibacter sp.]|jgi:LysM repeat protein|uniref:LysM peptidoglycan-binding domain-containing protein n=1 Tax=Tepidibacter sp. TaxID=2529387 RepID=UPI0025EEAAEF|nr:LysM peptidoglycan-binding domain-containing protein [Tepidibacter sp.]MCT4508244.1 LysM peptidoglycan-binding domain-containing protein [Tepidibacter sp.]